MKPAHVFRRSLAIAILAVSSASSFIRAFAEPAPEPQVIEVTARRFEFVPSRIEVAVGQPVRLMVHSEDGVHGLEIKRFKVNKDIPRGDRPVAINFTPTAEGEFPIMCSEYCGDHHEDMQGTLVVHARDASSPSDHSWP